MVFHPNIRESKVNYSWMLAAKDAGFCVKEMYGIYPNWKIDVEREQQDLLDHDRIVLQFPFFWYSSPALLKLWLDTVLTYGFAFGPEDKIQLRGKDLLLVVSVGGPYDSYVPGGYNNFSVTEFLRPFQQTAFLCRMNYITPFWMNGTSVASQASVDEYAKKMVLHINTASRAYSFIS